MKIHEIMTDEVVFLLPDHNAHDAARKMKALNVGVIPICDNDQRLLGLITDRDIVLRVVAEDIDPREARLGDCATMDPVSAQREWDVEDAVSLMTTHQIRRLPVVENGRLVGIISLGDLAVEQQNAALSGGVLEQISEPAAPQRGAIKDSSHTA